VPFEQRALPLRPTSDPRALPEGHGRMSHAGGGQRRSTTPAIAMPKPTHIDAMP
jgi:hypothetical protein